VQQRKEVHVFLGKETPASKTSLLRCETVARLLSKLSVLH
jgi:hypothetical protein